MDRRSFIQKSSMMGLGLYMANKSIVQAKPWNVKEQDWYASFNTPESMYRPFVRWWWNGDKVEATEISRQLRLLKDAGIGGVEINPISFPSRGDDLGKKSVEWLSQEWIELVKHAAQEAKSLGMTSDLIVGSGWPYGSETLTEDQRAQVVLVYAEQLEGPQEFEVSHFSICQAVDPQVTDKNPMRRPEILSLHLAADPMIGLEDAIDLSSQKDNQIIRVSVPEGSHVFYAVVKYHSFAQVINGAPGASGSILNHMDKKVVEDYLNNMSVSMENKIGALNQYLRALFTDSMELEGCNWTDDYAQEFHKRCGYKIEPFLPFILFKVGRLGNIVDENYGANKSEDFKEILTRVRFDFEYVKACLLKERFTDTYLAWCRRLKVRSRAQAYGRGFFPLETSLGYDIPEGESWTTNYLKHKLGEEMPDEDYRRGRGYTMINKYVSSAAHLTGKRLVSCEEMTNTYLVFNATLELLKLGSDQSIMSGITHSIWHGFNYSPKNAPFPGWVQYGSYYSEKNNWWPYFNLLNTYKARLSSQLQNADQYTDIAILPANYDLWSENGVQTDPFPEKLNVPYTSLLWEAINKNGGSADYITEIVLKEMSVSAGKLCYGPKSYGVLFLPGLKRISPEALDKLLTFVKQGGQVICIESYPHKSLGYNNWQQRDQQITQKVEELKAFPDRFMLLEKPQENKFLEWYTLQQSRLELPHYLRIENPDRYFMQNRYLRSDGTEFYFFQNAHRENAYSTRIEFLAAQTKRRQAWVWDLESGERFKLSLDASGGFTHEFGPVESLLIVFDNARKGAEFRPMATSGSDLSPLKKWSLELQYSLADKTERFTLDKLCDFKDDPRFVNFSGTAIYKTVISHTGNAERLLNLGTVYGVSDLYVNNQQVGAKWFGRRIYDISKYLQQGNNEIEVRVVTSMGNYMKTMTDNAVAQHWVNRPGREQPIQSMGMAGPVELYNKK